MRLRGEVHDRVVSRHQLVEQRRVADVAHHELGAGALDVGGVAGVGELVEHGDLDLGVALRHVVHEV